MRPSARFRPVAGVLVCAAILLVTACAGESGTPEASGAEADGPQVELTIATFNEFGYADLYAEYQAAHPNIKIVEQHAKTVDDHVKNLDANLARGTGLADIEAMEVSWIYKYLAKDAKFDNWALFFRNQNDVARNMDCPTIAAWKFTSPVTGPTAIAERNPYYFAVDTDGNQLPYIDTLSFEFHEKQETMVLRALNGEIDMQDRHIASLQNKSVFFDGQQKGNFKLYETTGSSMNTSVIALNLAHKDPEMRKIFQDKRFRQALSHAINRKRINEVAYFGLGKERNAILIPFDVEAARIYTTIRRQRMIRAPDAVQLACAAQARVDLFITNDERLSRYNIPGIQFVASLERAFL